MGSQGLDYDGSVRSGQAGDIQRVAGRDDTAPRLYRNRHRVGVGKLVGADVGLGKQRADKAGERAIGVPRSSASCSRASSASSA